MNKPINKLNNNPINQHEKKREKSTKEETNK